ncbi:uncharacterized protein LOC135394349 isoform X2 [Ornithodoros turicata]|uniref:uncharacterized protein LOC135394349 isoform X2 n=1 Tax=Ornithodoros turicata TaxID=34597 RepID=UPI0031387F12
MQCASSSCPTCSTSNTCSTCNTSSTNDNAQEHCTPVPCPQETTDHALLHLPASLQYPSVENAPLEESVLEGEYRDDHYVEPIACGVSAVDNAPGTESATEETHCSREHGAELDTSQSKMDETEADSESAMHLGSDSTEDMLVQSFIANPSKDTAGDVVPASVAIPVQVYTEVAQVQDTVANPVPSGTQGCTERDLTQNPGSNLNQNDTKEAVVLDSLDGQNLDSTEGVLGQDSVADPIQTGNGGDLVLDSLGDPKQNNSDGALVRDSVVDTMQNNTEKDMVLGSTDNPNQNSSEGSLVEGSVTNTVQHTEEDLVLDSIDSPNQDSTEGSIVQDTVVNPVRRNSGDLVVDCVDNPNKDSTEVVMQSSVDSSVQNDTEEGHVPDYLSNMSQGSVERALLTDPTTNPNQNDSAEVLVQSSQVEHNQNTSKDLVIDSVISPIQKDNKQAELDGDIKGIMLHSDHSEGIEDDISQTELPVAPDVEPKRLVCAPTETVCANEAKTMSICVNNVLTEKSNTTTRVLSADLAVSMEPYEEQQEVTCFEAISRVSDEISNEGTEHSVDQSLCDYNTNETTVGHCLPSTAEIAPSLVAPDTEPVMLPYRTILTVRPCTEINLSGGAIHAEPAKSAEDKAKSISEFCDHIDASAQVWVAKMREQLNAETEMEYAQIVTSKQEVFVNLDQEESCLQPSGSFVEQVIHSELEGMPGTDTVKGDAHSNPHTDYETGTQNLPVECSADMGHPAASDMGLESSYVAKSESGCEAKQASECYEPVSIASAQSRSETQGDIREAVSPYCEKSASDALDCNLLPTSCSELEVMNQGEITIDTNTCVDVAPPVHDMQCEEQDHSVGFVDCSHSVPSPSLEIQSVQLDREALKMEYVAEIDRHPVEPQKEVDIQHMEIDLQTEIHTNPVEMNSQSQVSTHLVEADTQLELAVQPLQIDSQAKVDAQTTATDPQSEMDKLTIPVIDTQSVEIDHLTGTLQPCIQSECPGSPPAIHREPMEMDFHSETDHKSVALELEAHTQADQVDTHQSIDVEPVEMFRSDSEEGVGTASESSPVVVAECEKATEEDPMGGLKQEEKICAESALCPVTTEDYSGEKQCTDSEAKHDVVKEQDTKVNVSNIDIKPSDIVERENLENAAGSSCERCPSAEDEKMSKGGVDPGWVDDEDDTQSSGEALLHIVESVPEESIPLDESNDRQPEDDHFLGASGGRSIAASTAEKTPNVGAKRKKMSTKKELPPKESSPNPGVGTKGICRRKPLFRLNLDFPDGAPLKCSACKSIFTDKNLIVEHILHAHYNLARVNDEQELSDAEQRSALLQASKVISRFECKNDGCYASFATHISYYMHQSRCSMAPISTTDVPKSKRGKQQAEEDNHEGPRKKRRSALQAMKSFTSMPEEQPSSRESDVTDFSDDCSDLSDEPLSDWSMSSGDEDSLSALQSWRGRFKGPEGCGEKLPQNVIKGWVKGSPCPNKGCTKEFQTLLGLKYHYPRCSQGSFYECCRCGLGNIKHSWAMLRHLRSCYLDRPKGDVSKKRARGKMQSRRPCELHQNTVDFRKKHYAMEMLYKDWRPSKWEPLPKSDAELYLPVFRESPALRLGDVTWNTMKLFEVSHQKAHTTLFVGGAVWAAAWCPVPDDEEQWVALACCPDPDADWPLVTVDPLPCTRGLLQIWCLGKLNGSECNPKLALLLGHDWGLITDIAWCPSGCWEPPGTGHRLGLLALACVDGSVRIISVPHEMPTVGDIVVRGGVVPSVTLESPAGASLCARLAWYPARHHSLFAAGYGNGMVSLFDLETNSVLLRGSAPDGSSSLQPCQVIQAHVAAITGLAWSHCTHEPFLASASIDRSAKLWSMNDPAAPVTLFRRGMLRSLAMCQHWNGMFLAGDETYTNSRVVTLYKENGYFNYVPKSLMSNNCTSWWVSISEWLNMAAACDVGGHVSAISLPFLSGNLDSNKKHRRGRVFIYQTNMVPLDASLPTPQDATSHAVAVKHFGLMFQDSPLDSWSASQDAKGYTVSPNQYHLNSINTVSWNPNGLSWLLSGGQAGIVRLSWLGRLTGKRSKPP